MLQRITASTVAGTEDVEEASPTSRAGLPVRYCEGAVRSVHAQKHDLCLSAGDVNAFVRNIKETDLPPSDWAKSGLCQVGANDKVDMLSVGAAPMARTAL